MDLLYYFYINGHKINNSIKLMILPGTTVTIIDKTSIYCGYVGFVQRISGTNAAVLFDNYSPWEKMITFPIKSLKEGGIGPK